MMHIGTLIQKIHLQSACWAKAPPMIGPVSEPSAQTPLWYPNHVPRSRSGTRSVINTSDRLMMPPPPMPWMVRPASRTTELLATAATIAPAVNKMVADKRMGLRPKLCEREAKVGWKTVLASKKDVPHQKASIAVVWSCWDMIYGEVKNRVITAKSNGSLTGSATESDVASRAAASRITQRLLKAP